MPVRQWVVSLLMNQLTQPDRLCRAKYYELNLNLNVYEGIMVSIRIESIYILDSFRRNRIDHHNQFRKKSSRRYHKAGLASHAIGCLCQHDWWDDRSKAEQPLSLISTLQDPRHVRHDLAHVESAFACRVSPRV